MKLIRFGEPGAEKPGIIVDGKYFDVSSLVTDYNEAFFGGDGLEKLKKDIDSADLPEVDQNVRLGAALARPSKIICVGLNYKDHAAETNAPIPAEPILFFKATSAIVGPNDDLIIPKNS
ncbi:MAG: fumarylacetoacetate hydrolase family protein, partial [Pedobacter agri]